MTFFSQKYFICSAFFILGPFWLNNNISDNDSKIESNWVSNSDIFLLPK